MYQYTDKSYEEKIFEINEYIKAPVHLDAELIDFLSGAELKRHQILIDTLYYCVCIYKKFGLKELDKRAMINVPKNTDAEKEFIEVNHDWGDCLTDLTKKHGKVFTVVNTTDSLYLGGKHLDSEFFSRTNCFFFFDYKSGKEYLRNILNTDYLNTMSSYTNKYNDEMQDLLNGVNGVYLDERKRLYLVDSYGKLDYRGVLPFYEMRSYNNITKDLIRAQLDTLIEKKKRHFIFCNAFVYN
jgi:hypothetical protein